MGLQREVLKIKHEFHGLVKPPVTILEILGVRSVNNFDFDILVIRSVNNFDFDIFGVRSVNNFDFDIFGVRSVNKNISFMVWLASGGNF